jgi:hypothetical protein
MRWRLGLLGLLLAMAAGVRADEIRLKDGSKIVGTIVDFEDESFKVQTAYGFAMVRKDSIAQIIPDAPAPSSETTKAASAPTVRPATAAVSSPAVRAETQPAVSRGATAVTPTPARSALPTLLPMPAPNPRGSASVAAAPPVPASAPAPVPAPALAPEPAALPPPPVVPGPIRESVQGNIYTNETYNFHLYRPPGWDVMPEARKALPNAITAMGTSDRATLFVIGREPVRDSLEAQAGNAERALQNVYENYREISSRQAETVNGLPAIEWRFRGVADGHDWSVTALTVASDNDVFTLLGMTYADSDLIMQIRENVIAKMMASLQFSAPR